MFICTLKIIDPSQFTQAKGWQYSQLVIYATKLEDLPFVLRLGDIIRVHRADMKFYNGKRQFNVNMLYKGSWALYSTDKQTPIYQSATNDKPYAISGHRATEERQDASIVSTLKNWANMTFKSVDVCGKIDQKTVSLKDASKKSGDFDVVAKITQMFELDDYTNEVKLRDMSGTTYYVLALKVKFPHLKTGSVVKIRSATYDTTSGDKNCLILQHYSNIMTFIASSKKASDVSSKVSDDRSNETKALKSSVAMTPVVLTEVSSKYANLPVTSLHDLFHSAESSTTTFRTCFYVTKVEPGSAADAVKVYDKKTKKTSSAKGAKGGDLIYQV